VLSIAKSGPKMTLADDSGHPVIRQMGRWGIKAEGVPIPLFTRFLSARLHATVVDETGLKDRFNFDLKWAPDLSANQPLPPMSGSDDQLIPAITEQLGLRLDAQKVETDTYVIEHAERPTEN
jgi:uncharacterized protein (TIGR03435 family)